MASSVVVKVKYEDTLRRFNVIVHEDRQMDIDIGALRAKIRSLFNLTDESDLKLTYIDEDLDVVALVDQEDLCDVVKQGLNPLRITVQLNTSGTSSPRPKGRWNRNTNASGADHLKSVHPLREALSKFSAEASSKAASSSRALADLVDTITKATKVQQKNSGSAQETSPCGIQSDCDVKTTECVEDDAKKKLGTQGSIFHRGVRCDGCEAVPITGPRFKSKVKEDYDLCNLCFSQMGNEADYVRIDFPAPYRHPWSFKGHLVQFGPSLDSHFVRDINVADGTIMPPKTSFTKIWRMRNNGNLPWAYGTQLVWIDGDKFSSSDSVEIEIPVTGLLPEDEVDVAVDFVAPESPGRYITHWMMATPAGGVFGQRVWALIQVDASTTDAPASVVSSLNLNLPPESHEEKNIDAERSVDVENAPSSVSHPAVEADLPDPAATNAEMVQDDVEKALLKELQEMGFKQVNLNKEILRRNDYDLEWSLEELCEFSESDLLLEELRAMGFVDKEKNKRVLAKNNGSLKHAVMELIAAENA